MVHGWNANSESWPTTMEDSIKSSIEKSADKGIEWTVGTLDWGVDAGNSDYSWAIFGDKLPWTAWSNAAAQGEWLAKQIGGQYDYVHLIAHSAGSNVIQEATLQIRKRTDLKQPKIHLTFLDAYHPLNALNGNLLDIDLSSYGEAADWAEHYVDRSILPAVPGTDTTLRRAFNFDVTGWSPRPDCLSVKYPLRASVAL